MPREKRILFVTREFTVGGAAYLALAYLGRLNPYYHIDLLVTGPSDEQMLQQIPTDVNLYRIEADRQRRGMDAFGYLERLLEHRDLPPFQHHYQALLATSVFPDWHSCLTVSLVQARRKLVFLVDESLAVYPTLKPKKQSAVACCLMAADRVLPVSNRLWHRMAESCTLLTQRPWRVLHPPIDPQAIQRRSWEALPEQTARTEPLVLTAARLSPEKQLLQCLRIHQRLHQQGIHFRWVILGLGPEEARLRQEIQRLGMGEHFMLMGHQDNVPAWMRACDFFALLSSSEGCPTVVMEALTVGCPVLMTDVNGSDELVKQEVTGLIVPNEESAIEEGLKRMVTDATLRERFRNNLATQLPLANPEDDTAWLMECIDRSDSQDLGTEVPKVTILIPTYNHERYIDKAISSALMQDFPSLEVVVADDASSDRTERMARTWLRDPRFRYERNEKNLGRVANYRKALTELARGEWVLLLDGDDFLTDPGFIRRSWEAIQRHTPGTIVFAQGGHRVHYSLDDRGDVDILPSIEGEEQLMAGGDYLRFVYDTGFFTHLGALYNRKAAVAHGFYTADISSSDMDSLLRLALGGDVLVLNTLAGCWVQHDKNTSSNLPLDEIAANVRIFRQIARMAARRGLTSMSQIDGVLSRYEARTLAYLFGQTIGKTAKGPLAVIKMLGVTLSVNPRLLLNRDLVSVCRRHLRRLLRSSVKQRFTALLNRVPRKKKGA